MAHKKIPDIKIILDAKEKQCLTAGGHVKIVADKILRYALFDNGAQLAVLFKDEDHDNHLRGVNLMIVDLSAPRSKMALLEPQPVGESENDVFFTGDRRNKTITVHFKSKTGKFYNIRSDNLEIFGPFNESPAHPD